MKVAMIGPFALGPKGTMRMRGLPMVRGLTAGDHEVEMFLAPWSNPEDSGRQEERGGVKIQTSHSRSLSPSCATSSLSGDFSPRV